MFIKAFVVVLTLVVTIFTPVQGQGFPYENLIIEQAAQYDVDPLDIAAIIAIESNWNPDVSNDFGATGLGGVVAKEGGEVFKYRPTMEELKDPETNIMWTCRIYRTYLNISGDYKLGALYRYSGYTVWPDKATFIWNYWYKFIRVRRELEYAGFGG